VDAVQMQGLAERVKAALEAADVAGFRDLLHPDVTWGPPDDDASGCHNRSEVIAWHERGRASGATAEVTEVTAGTDKLLIGFRVVGTRGAAARDGEVDRWQVLTVRDGKVIDIRGFDDRAEAARRVGAGI